MSAARRGDKSDEKRSGETLAKARRLVIKVGSALLADEAEGSVRRAWLSFRGALVRSFFSFRRRPPAEESGD